MEQKRQRKKFKNTTVGKLVGGAVSLINPTLGDLINGQTDLAGALEALKGAPVTPEDKIRVRELLLEAYEIEVTDRIAAREREARVAASGGSDILFKTIGWGILLAFLMMISGAVGLWEVPTENQRMFDMAFGSVTTAMMAIVSYYFGSSIGSKQKTHIMKGSDV